MARLASLLAFVITEHLRFLMATLHDHSDTIFPVFTDSHSL
jgi:hypothetical protein